MSSWWYVILVLLVALVAVVYLRDRRNRAGTQRGQQTEVIDGRDFQTERTDSRHAGMSAEDREWETASLRRNQDNEERKDQLANPRSTTGASADEPGPRG